MRQKFASRRSQSTNGEVLYFKKDSYDGYWIDKNGEEIATIKGDAILFVGGFVTQIERRGQGVFAVSVDIWGEIIAMRDQAGRLAWNDDDVWDRSGLGQGVPRSLPDPSASHSCIRGSAW